jgi:hypothetical protein
MNLFFANLACARVQLAPMSTTTKFRTAAEYSVGDKGGHSLIFKIKTRNNLQRGADLKWLSAFPTEAEILFPPLTYLQPTGSTQQVVVEKYYAKNQEDTDKEEYLFTIVEVTPTIA